jgi:arylsulfatase A-like enzyme
MDCVRADDFIPDPSSNYLPFAGELAKESVRFTRAVSPASWTVPSHASLFTGLYPWEHGAHSEADWNLRRDTPTLAGMLRPLGYSSVSLSANFLVSPRFGLVNDFDSAYWGGWWEPYLRSPSGTKKAGVAPSARKTIASVLAHGSTNKSWLGPPPILQLYSPFILKRTYLLDMAHRLLLKMNNGRKVGVTSPWIEPTLDRWMPKQPSDKPVFCMINLLDAHEPYFSSDEVIHGIREWLKYARLSQERQGWIKGEWKATPEKLAVLHKLYRQSLGDIDSRLNRIVDAFKKAGRWENTLAIVTSDHGQAFGEHGKLFHIFGVAEPGVRVPLWVRYPDGHGAGTQESSWVSLVDVLPTVMKAMGDQSLPKCSGHPLQTLEGKLRPDPVITISDSYGYVESFAQTKQKRVTRAPKPLQIAAYHDEWKVVADWKSSLAPRAYKIDMDPGETNDLWDGKSENLLELAKITSGIVTKMLKAKAPGTSAPSQEITDRLRAWGYVD